MTNKSNNIKVSSKRNTNKSDVRVKRQQPRKGSNKRRVNYDNTRVERLEEDVEDGKIKFPMKTSKSNDISWYTRNASLSAGSSNITFYNVVGNPIPKSQNITLNGIQSMTSVPGVIKYAWTPYVGTNDCTILQQAADSIYSYTVHANSRNTSYDATDQMMLIMAGASVFSMIAAGIRAYGTMQQFKGDNLYTPEILLRAQGFSYSSLKQNYSHMWFDLNHLIAQSKQIWIPKVMPVIERWIWLNTHIYMDAQSSKAQYYLFTPHTYLLLNEKGNSQGTSLDYKKWNDTGYSDINIHTWEQYLDIVQLMIDTLIQSQDRGLIFGDLLKAYGPENIYAMNEIEYTYTTIPTWDTEVLSQMENLTVYPEYPSYLQQDANNSTFKYIWPAGSASSVEPVYTVTTPVLNFHQSSPPTPEQIIIASRLITVGAKVWYTPGSTTNFSFIPETCGTEIINQEVIYYYGWKDGVMTGINIAFLRNSCLNELSGIYSALLSTFDWHAFHYAGTVDTSNVAHGMTIKYINGDFDNYTFLDWETIRRMHTAAVYSEFGVPYLK